MTAQNRKPELLAPAGTLEVFETAVEAGADAIYIGAPALNARALAKQFSMAEIAAMIGHAHEHRVKVYLAMNSLVREEELPLAARTLAMIEALGADGLILQDLGIYRLARRHFPGLRLHASTLLAAHNSLAVWQLGQMGFRRVVLAREVTLEEIGRIRAASGEVELEVFIHGALCFSYSGLCLFSSYLGGKSGLRGRCVQPCRRRYTWTGRAAGGQSGYFFSMHDLEGLGFLSRLQAAGVTSFKIEGRMRSAEYVGRVVRAYRLALDAPGQPEKLAEAAELLKGALGRRVTPGYFGAAEPPRAFAPEQSGNIGQFLGKINTAGSRAGLRLQFALAAGDRLRLHQENSGERVAFTLKHLWRGRTPVEQARPGEQVSLALPAAAAVGDSLYKVDTSEGRSREGRAGRLEPGRFTGLIRKLERGLRLDHLRQELGGGPGKSRPKRGPGGKPSGLDWQLRLDDLRQLPPRLDPAPREVVVLLSRENLTQAARNPGMLKPYHRRLVWSLPPIIEEAEVEIFRQSIEQLQDQGYHRWQLGHLGQVQFFGARSAPQSVLSGDYTLNVLNSLAVKTLRDLGLESIQLAIETDRDNLRQVCRQAGGNDLGLTIYGRPPLFTARPAPAHFRYQHPLVSPKGEKFVLERRSGHTLALAAAPFSLLDFLPELSAAGLAYGVVDLSHLDCCKGELRALLQKLSGAGGPARRKRLSTFNYLGRLQ